MLDRWHPIDTAPKDGTPILVWFRGRIHVAEYGPIFVPDNKHWYVREPSTGEREQSNTVHQIDPPTIDGRLIPGTWFGPSHWMPLPKPPLESEHAA